MPIELTVEQINDMAFISVMETNDTLMEGIATIKGQRDELRALLQEMLKLIEAFHQVFPVSEIHGKTLNDSKLVARARAVPEPQEAPDAK